MSAGNYDAAPRAGVRDGGRDGANHGELLLSLPVVIIIIYNSNRIVVDAVQYIFITHIIFIR